MIVKVEMKLEMYRKVLYCDDSMEGIFTAVYQAYEMKLNHENTAIRIMVNEDIELFTEYIRIESDEEKCRKVARTINSRFGYETFFTVCECMASRDINKANYIYHMIVHGINKKINYNLIKDLGNTYVQKVFELARACNFEILHLRGFLRFEELSNGLLFSKIGPKNNIITFLAQHFADRLPNENFVIYDEIRQMFILHPAFSEWVVVTGDYLNESSIEYSESEIMYSSLFKEFCSSIAIKERRNISLQKHMLPLRFQKYMKEFK